MQMFVMRDRGLIVPRDAISYAKTRFSLRNETHLIFPTSPHQQFEIDSRNIVVADIRLVGDGAYFGESDNVEFSIKQVELVTNSRRVVFEESEIYKNWMEENKDNEKLLNQPNVRMAFYMKHIAKEEALAMETGMTSGNAVEDENNDLEIEAAAAIESKISDEEIEKQQARIEWLKKRFEKNDDIKLPKDASINDIINAIGNPEPNFYDPYYKALEEVSAMLSK